MLFIERYIYLNYFGKNEKRAIITYKNIFQLFESSKKYWLYIIIFNIKYDSLIIAKNHNV